MANTLKVLGQIKNALTTLETLYTVPAATTAVANLKVCNQSSVATSFRVAIRQAGVSIADKHYIAYDVPIDGNDVVEIRNMALGATDVVSVYATLATLSMTLMGQENV